jgi:hypothetical protein
LTREVAHDLFGRQQRITSIVFDVELIYLARRRGYRIAVVPIQWSDKQGSRMHPGSSWAPTLPGTSSGRRFCTGEWRSDADRGVPGRRVP